MLKIFSSLGIVIAVVWFISSGPAQSDEKKAEATKQQLTQGKDELKVLQRKIQDKKSRLKETQKEESKVISELNRIEKDLFRKQQTLKGYDTTLKRQEQEIQKLNCEVEKLQGDINDQKNNVAFQMKALYTLSRMSMAEALFSSDSLPSLMQRYAYLTRMIAYREGVIDNYGHALAMIQNYQQHLRENERELEALTEKTRATQEDISQHKRDKTVLLTSIKSEKELHLKALAELEQASARLQGLIEKLERGVSPATSSLSTTFSHKNFSALKNKLAFPVEGTIITYFGKQEDPEFSTISHNKGIEIAAAMGSPIKAVFDGNVIYSDWFKGYGNIIIIDHGEGYYTLSGHAAELFKKVGEQIKEGEPIGYVGDTGSFKGPNLYFEIRHHGKPLDPLEWLRRN